MASFSSRYFAVHHDQGSVGRCRNGFVIAGQAGSSLVHGAVQEGRHIS